MDERTAALGVIVLAAIAIAVATLGSPAADVAGTPTADAGSSPAPTPADDPEVVRVVDADGGDTLATVSITVADTPEERRTGLSEHESLPAGTGMWFVFDREAGRTFHMRGMNFSIDMLFVGSDGRINRIHHSAVPDTGGYRGRARWVLEVNAGVAAEYGIEDGDRVVTVSGDN
jgi:uncharacterized membrane protein (UPF0127 family)